MRLKLTLLAGAATLSLLTMAACSTAEPPSSNPSASTGGGGSAPGASATLCPDKGAKLTDLYGRPKVKESKNISTAVEEPAHDYNNNTATANNFSNSLFSLTLPSAFFIDSNLDTCVDGDLLTSVEQTKDDPLTITYKIKPEAVWSDGQPLSCKDFYLAYLAGASKATTKGAPAFDPATTLGYDQMKPPTCSDNNKTVTTVYNKPFGDYRAMFQVMVPAHVVEADSGVSDLTKIAATDTSGDVAKVAAAYIKDFAGFTIDKDLSAGPYLVKSASDEQLVLARNDKWWGNPAGPETITNVTNADGQSEVQSLQNQEVQVISPQPDAGLATQLKNLPNVKFSATPGATFEHIDFQMKDPLFQGTTGKALRQAMFYCVDRTDIITKLVAGVNPDTKPLGNFLFLPKEQAYTDHYTDYQTANVDKAKQAMEAGGWKLGSDGVYAANGQKAQFRLGHKVIDNRERIAQLVGSSCAKAGIKVTDDQDAQFNAKRLPAGDFDTALFAWVGTPFKSGNVPVYLTKGGGNYNNYSNPEVDKQFNLALSETDATKRNEEYNKADELMSKDLASIPLYQFSDMIAHTTQITPALTYDGTFGGPYWNAFEWVMNG